MPTFNVLLKKIKRKKHKIFPAISTCLLPLVGTAYPIMNMFEVNN